MADNCAPTIVDEQKLEALVKEVVRLAVKTYEILGTGVVVPTPPRPRFPESLIRIAGAATMMLNAVESQMNLPYPQNLPEDQN
jgi:hypothetical protein